MVRMALLLLWLPVRAKCRCWLWLRVNLGLPTASIADSLDELHLFKKTEDSGDDRIRTPNWGALSSSLLR